MTDGPTVTWWASTSPQAPFVAHLLPDGRPEYGRAGTALCGEHRRSWQRRDDFGVPSAFTPCPACWLKHQRATA